MDGVFGTSLSVINDMIRLFGQPPLVYFVAVALVGSIATITRIFVPTKRR